MAVGPRGCGLAQKKQVDIDWLLRQKLVLPSHSHGLRTLIEHAAAKKKLKLDVQIEADSFRVLTSLVEEGLGYALLPPSSVRAEVADGRLEIATISKPAPMRELTIASPIEHPGSTAITLVTDLLRKEVERLPRGRPLGYPDRLNSDDQVTAKPRFSRNRFFKNTPSRGGSARSTWPVAMRIRASRGPPSMSCSVRR